MRVQGKSVKEYLADVRLDAWLFLELRKEGTILPLDNFGDRNFRENLVSVVGEGRVAYLIESRSRFRLLPEERLDWITEDKRQAVWLSSFIQKEVRFSIYPVPARLFGRGLVLANLDFLDWDLNSKADFVEKMRWSWNEHIKGDRIFSWFQGEDEASRCAVAWEWLIEKKGPATHGRERISTYAEILMFFDSLNEGDAQKRLDIASIKNRWSQQKYRKKMVGKKQYNLLLSDNAIADLDKLALKYGVSRPQIIEALIQFEAKKGVYLPEKIKMTSWD